ncbi:tRNA A-37 threonylcarbamoyl transferase component Bud32 [Nocardiopsis mwathae]|uniref:non-specific serine/threonine protein kinase n=1 Tax=Nocardiopsis mwathae TaxID=1472723 RepID=A0A7W9YMM7_9ACTN|nr:serine/threonine-protein kinase [Nocardiopsis mwathae]MBB6174779.1 tRNA A-37 threonylcarbamoyl transferase component Bud32 [Nocardiopsis mwathae]
MSTEHSEPGRLLAGRYRLTETIGEGGMGRVWQGTDELLDRPVAIKELSIPPHLPQQEVDVLRTRMLREARSAARLAHPSIITVFDVVEEDERPWIVMELVRGDSLSGLLKKEGTLPPERVAKIGLQMLAALAVAHERGIVHRDIKPGNVLIARGDRAVLTDFGIARLEGTTALTSTGLLIGSPAYLAPEQAHGKPASSATDMWSLGVTLYQALEGQSPFQRPTSMATLTAIVTEEVPPAEHAGPLVPLLEGLLAKEPEHRMAVREAASLLQKLVSEGEKKATWTAGAAAGAAPTASGPSSSPSPSAADEAPARTGTAAEEQPVGAMAAERPVDIPPGPGPGGGTPGRSPRALVTAVAGALALVLVIGLGAYFGLRSLPGGDPAAGGEPGETGQPAPTAGADTDGTGTGDEDSDSDSDDDSEDGDADLPEMETYTDSTGYSVDVPTAWNMERESGSRVKFRFPDRGYLQIDHVGSSDDAEDYLHRQQGAYAGSFDGFGNRSSVTSLDADWTGDYRSAAQWEFTFGGSGYTRNCVSRGFFTENEGYTILLVSKPEDFDQNVAILDAISTSFEPAS